MKQFKIVVVDSFERGILKAGEGL